MSSQSNLSNNTIDASNPLYLHPSDHPGMMLVSKIFDGSGFASWKRAMSIASWKRENLLQQIMYWSIFPDGPLHLWEFIAMVTVVMMVLSQLPSFHSLRHVNLASLLLSLAYTFVMVVACLHAGISKNAPSRDYSLQSSKFSVVMSAFTSISIIAAIFGNGIVPEIQATLAPPVTGKMFKGLMMCYAVIFVTFYSAAISGYYVFGNKASSNILTDLMPDEGPALAPTWLLGLGVVFILLQLFAIGLVTSDDGACSLGTCSVCSPLCWVFVLNYLTYASAT